MSLPATVPPISPVESTRYVLEEPHLAKFFYCFVFFFRTIHVYRRSMLSSIYCCTSHKICCSRILRYQKHSTAQRNQLAQSRVRQRKQADREHLLIVRCVCCIVAVPEVQHSAAQSAGTKPLRKQVFTYVRADQSGTTQPSRLGESQYAVVEIQYEFSERRNRNLPGRHKYTIAHKALAGWCDARRFCL